MKYKLYLIAVCSTMLCASAVYANTQCPSIPEQWNGEGTLGDGWTINSSYLTKLHAKNKKDKESGYKPYKFLNAWIYYPDVPDSAVCHYNYEGEGGNQLSLVRPGINTCNTHFVPEAKEGGNGKGYHCKLNAAGCTFYANSAANPGYPKTGRNAGCPKE